MRTMLIALALLAATAAAEIRIRVTDDAGNVATVTINQTNRVAYVNEWVADVKPGTNTVAEKLADVAKEHIAAWSIEAKRSKVRAAKAAEADAAAEALKD